MKTQISLPHSIRTSLFHICMVCLVNSFLLKRSKTMNEVDNTFFELKKVSVNMNMNDLYNLQLENIYKKRIVTPYDDRPLIVVFLPCNVSDNLKNELRDFYTDYSECVVMSVITVGECVTNFGRDVI